jgi:hypothetical protein
VGERDLTAEASGARRQRLLRCARAALEGGPVAFALHRWRRPVPSGAGLDRRHPAALLAVGLHLPQLAELPAVHNDPELFLTKLASLTRMALSAAVQKRAALRRHSPGQGFWLDRARLVAAPVGLAAAVKALLGRGLCEDKSGLDFARRIVGRLREVLAADGRSTLVDSCLETPWDFQPDDAPSPESGEVVVGLTPWETAAPRSQLRAAGVLHAAAGSGTAALLLPWDQRVSPEELLNLLAFAWRETALVCLRVVRVGRRQQTTLLGL